MNISGIGTILLAVGVIIFCLFIYLLYLTVRALRKYVRTKDVREEKARAKLTLGENIKKRRQECNMTQEFVAEALGVSRQSVSKWESGASDPSTSNLIALAKLLKTDPRELLDEIEQKRP